VCSLCSQEQESRFFQAQVSVSFFEIKETTFDPIRESGHSQQRAETENTHQLNL
jgi:hypothetical protein